MKRWKYAESRLANQKKFVSVETNLRTSALIAQGTGDSRAQVDRYIRLTYLLPEILAMVDDSKIAFRPAVELSYLAEKGTAHPL